MRSTFEQDNNMRRDQSSKDLSLLTLACTRSFQLLQKFIDLKRHADVQNEYSLKTHNVQQDPCLVIEHYH